MMEYQWLSFCTVLTLGLLLVTVSTVYLGMVFYWVYKRDSFGVVVSAVLSFMAGWFAFSLFWVLRAIPAKAIY